MLSPSLLYTHCSYLVRSPACDRKYPELQQKKMPSHERDNYPERAPARGKKYGRLQHLKA